MALWLLRRRAAAALSLLWLLRLRCLLSGKTMPPTGVAVQDEGEDKMASETHIWLPRTVVKAHRTKATIIFISLVIAFLAYISFIVWDTVDSRRDPAASFQLKKEVFSFPDVAICLSRYQGCVASNLADCVATSDFQMLSQYGFMNETLEADEASLEIEGAYDQCRVLPASKLQVNQTGIDNGDITYLTASFALSWFEDPRNEYDPTEYIFVTQFVNLFFLNVDDGVEAIGEEIADAKLPYDRVTPTFGESMPVTTSHMVLELTEFQPISAASGNNLERERTFTQSTTTGKLNWYWTGVDYEVEAAWLVFDLFIPKFEYTSIEEVDPVDAWAIIGAIGGVWQFVVIAFGLFFVYSEKQPPDKKLRNFRKSMAKPATIVARRFSSTTSRGSSTQEDVVVDASDEDLPAEWVKRQRKDGSFYYCNAMTGAVQDSSPHDGVAGATVVAPNATRPRRGIASMFQPAHRSPAGTDDGSPEYNGTNLPPGWREGKDSSTGKTYYVNTVLKTTQWKRPKQRSPSASGSSVQAVDVPMAHSRRRSGPDAHHPSSVGDSNGDGGGSNGGSVGAAPSYLRTIQMASLPPVPDGLPPSSVSKAPSYRTMASLPDSSRESLQPANAAETSVPTAGGGAGTSPVPPGWDRHSTEDGKTYYVNATTKVPQWHAP